MKNTKKIIGIVFLLVFIDMLIKVLIHQYFMDTRFAILPPYFYFQPTFNTRYLYIAHLFNLNISLWGSCLVGIVSLFIVCLVYRLLSYVFKNPTSLVVAFCFGLAGNICFFLSNTLWIGCLDYIYLKPFFIFDLKDLYLNIYGVLLGYTVFTNYRSEEIKELEKEWIAKEKATFTALWKSVSRKKN